MTTTLRTLLDRVDGKALKEALLTGQHLAQNTNPNSTMAFALLRAKIAQEGEQ